jgi:hypothetical protein
MVQTALDDTTHEQPPPPLVFDAARLSGQADIPEHFLWPADESPTPNTVEDTSHNVLRPWTHPAAEDRFADCKSQTEGHILRPTGRPTCPSSATSVLATNRYTSGIRGNKRQSEINREDN